MLKTVAFLRGHKWTSMMVKRVYFGNWLRGKHTVNEAKIMRGNDLNRLLSGSRCRIPQRDASRDNTNPGLGTLFHVFRICHGGV